MAEHGMTQSALAKKAGIPTTSISRLMRHAVAPTTDTLERLALAFGVPAARLLMDTATSASGLVGVDPAYARRVAKLNVAYARCDDADQRLLLELAERLAAKGKKRTRA